jgi:hypothetical protein
MSRAGRLALLIVAASTLAAGAGYYFGNLRQVAPPPIEAVPTANAAARLLSLTLPDLEGKPQALSQWKGKVLVVNFWATWCPPCKEEMPEFSRLNNQIFTEWRSICRHQHRYSRESVGFQQRNAGFLSPAHQQSGQRSTLASDLGNRAKGLPFTIILRPDGSPQQVKLGKFATPDLEKAIQIGAPSHTDFSADLRQFWTICRDLRQTCRHERRRKPPQAGQAMPSASSASWWCMGRT